MIACFFAKSGHVAAIHLEARKTVTLDGYIIIHCMRSLPGMVQTASPNWCRWSTTSP